jgi:nicotinate-nucleotide pyrophosphorylase (carboxylating)
VLSQKDSTLSNTPLNKNFTENVNIEMQHILSDVKRALLEDLSYPSIEAVDKLNNEVPKATIHSLAAKDITASLISSDASCEAHIICREDIVMCGREWATQAFLILDPTIQLDWHFNDGDVVSANSSLVNIRGNARCILTSERTALNFLQLLSGTATTTASYVKYLFGSTTQLLDTRKTIPGFRQAQKYAVACGGGKNHRMGLFDAFLIKENHIKACGSIPNAIFQAKSLHPEKTLEIEVETLQELEQAIAAGTDIAMLDNFSTEQIQKAVSLNNQQCKLEVSGNITEQRLAELAKTGVDFVSSGAITKHVKAVDLSLLIL